MSDFTWIVAVSNQGQSQIVLSLRALPVSDVVLLDPIQQKKFQWWIVFPLKNFGVILRRIFL